jgi:hypothetical protein
MMIPVIELFSSPDIQGWKRVERGVNAYKANGTVMALDADGVRYVRNGRNVNNRQCETIPSQSCSEAFLHASVHAEKSQRYI